MSENSNSKKVIDWRNRTKRRIVISMGGKCSLCGYDKCDESLALHHLDPTQKEFGMGRMRANPKSWDKIVIELRKCILVCNNCHGEIHFNCRDIPDNVVRFDEKYLDYKLLNKQLFSNKCVVCGEFIPSRQKTCSYGCAATLNNSKNWGNDREILLKKYIEENRSWVSIAKEFEISSISVIKRAKKLGLIKKVL